MSNYYKSLKHTKIGILSRNSLAFFAESNMITKIERYISTALLKEAALV